MMDMSGETVLENVRRYRTIALLYRQTAAFRPHQRGSLLDQAQEWEDRAVQELETYFAYGRLREDQMPYAPSYTSNWTMAAAA